ncbi:MAG: hypothetical protein QM813_20380 [Verrucomicrobiota bacterium]
MIFGRQLWPGYGIGDKVTRVPRTWWVIVVGFALAGIWELVGLEHSLGNWARSFARAEDVYYFRPVLQRAVISVIGAALLVWFGFGGRRRKCSLWVVGFGLYVAIATVNLFSLHAIDRYATASWHGVTAVDAVKFSCAMLAFCSLYASSRKRKFPTAADGASLC